MMVGFGLKLLSEQDILLMCSADPVAKQGGSESKSVRGRGRGGGGGGESSNEWMRVDVAAAVTDAC